jgi:hypothetical protein
VQGGSFHAGHEFHQAGLSNISDQAVNDLVTQITMGHLSSLEAERGLDLIAFIQEANSLVLLRLIVMFVNGDGELDLFDSDDLLLLPCSSIALILLVEELAVVLNLADRGNRVGRDLHKVQRFLAGHFESLKRSHYAKLFAIFVDDSDFAGADALISADEGFSGTFIDRWNRSPPQQATGGMPCVSVWISAIKMRRTVKYSTPVWMRPEVTRACLKTNFEPFVRILRGVPSSQADTPRSVSAALICVW